MIVHADLELIDLRIDSNAKDLIIVLAEVEIAVFGLHHCEAIKYSAPSVRTESHVTLPTPKKLSPRRNREWD